MPDNTNEIWLKVFLFILFAILLQFFLIVPSCFMSLSDPLKIPFYQQQFQNNKENSYQKQLFPNKNSHFLTILVYALFLKDPIW